MVSRQRIQDYADQIAQTFHPDRIILFGSYAYGTPSDDSDVDLLVVMTAKDRDMKKALQIIQSCRPDFPLDVLVYDPAYLHQRANMEDWFVREILEKGRVLYEGRYAGLG
jgi:predicted nucleotidyltransferase